MAEQEPHHLGQLFVGERLQPESPVVVGWLADTVA
jgi:hypothetical protein